MEQTLTTDEVVAEAAPMKSKATYDKAWADFMAFKASLEQVKVEIEDDDVDPLSLPVDDSVTKNDDPGIQGSSNDEPTEETYIQYFNYLRKTRDFKSSSLWATYSRLNSCHQRKFGVKLQKWPRITILLKQYESGYTRKVAKIFTRDDIHRTLQLDYVTPKWVQLKCAIALGFCGGLRCIELKAIKFGSLKRDDDGVRVRYLHNKQSGEVKENKFLIPFNRNTPSLCMASRVMEYLQLLETSLRDIKPEDELFHKPLKTKYGKAVIGKNYIHKFGKTIATELGLDEPERYTGRCFRRTGATAVASAGATTVEMKRNLGWHQETTAINIVDETSNRGTKVARLLTDGKSQIHVSSSSISAGNLPQTSTLQVSQEGGKKIFNFNFANVSNVTLNFQ